MASWQDDLYEVFVAFASFGAGRAAKAEMDGAHFVKLCKDTGLIDRAFTTTNADLIFAKVKAKGDRKILFEAFLDALALVGELKFPRDPEGFDRVVLQILHSRGPSSSATAVADASGVFSKLTDHTLYTGAHKERFDADTGAGRGLAGRDSTAVGAGTVSGGYHGGPVSDLSQITRSHLSGAGTTLEAAHASRTGGGSGSPSAAGARPGSARPAAGGRPGSAHPASPSRAGGVGGFSGAGYGGGYGGGGGGGYEEGHYDMAGTGPGPRSPGGGGAGGAGSARRGYADDLHEAREADHCAAAPAPPVGGGGGGGGGELGYTLFDVFIAYCQFGGGSAAGAEEIDNAKFAKLCRESGLQDGKRVTPASVDIAFSKYKEKGRRTIDFARFQDAVASLALAKFPGLPEDAAFEAACAQILAAGGPALVGASKPRTDGIYSKLTDHTLYTGAHKERFDADTGAGRGLAGRESTAVGRGTAAGRYHGGPVSDLSQITRPNLH